MIIKKNKLLMWCACAIAVALWVNYYVGFATQVQLSLLRPSLSRFCRDHGRYPATLREMTALYYTNDQAARATARQLEEFHYVANTLTNDPLDVPIAISPRGRRGLFFGLMMTRGGDTKWLPNRRLDRLIEQPWAGSEGLFLDRVALEDYKRRTRGGSTRNGHTP